MGFDRAPGQHEETQIQSHPQRVRHAVASDCGCHREINEDRFLVVKAPACEGFFVFDGIAGERAGETAAQLSADEIAAYLSQAQPGNLQELLREAILRAHRRVAELRQSPEMRGMGTTVVGVLMRGAEVAVACVGDSRVYRVSPEGIQQVTTDHTLVQGLVDAGLLAPEDALMHPQSHILTRCLGADGEFEADLFRLWTWPCESKQSGDTLVLCTDGLYSLVSNQELCNVVQQSSPEAAVHQLVMMARERGGFDNITAMVVALPVSLRSEQPLKAAVDELSDYQSMVVPEVDIATAAQSQLRGQLTPASTDNFFSQLLFWAGLAGCAALITSSILTFLWGS